MGRYKDARKEMAASLIEYRKSERGLKDLSASIEGMGNQLKSLRQQEKASVSSQAKLNAAIAKAGKPTKEQALQIKKLVKEQRAYKTEIQQTTVKSKTLKKEQKGAIKVAKGVESAMQRQQERTDRLGNELKKTGVNTNRLADEQQRLKRDTNAATRALDNQNDKLNRLNRARTNLGRADSRFNDAQSRMASTAAVVATVVAPIVRAVDVESSVAEVDKVADFKGDEKEKFQSDLLKLGVEVNMAPGELAQIAASGAQSGNVKKEDLIAFTRSTAKMAVAFDMSAESAGETMIAWRDGMNLSTDQALNLMDAVNFVGNNTGGKASEISGVLLRQGANAKKSGLSPEKIAGLAGAMLSSKQGEEKTATAMKNMLDALVMGEKASKSKKEGLRELGLNPSDLPRLMQQNATGTIMDLFQRISTAPVEEQAGLMKQIMGEESVGAITPLLSNLSLLHKGFGLTKDPSMYKGSAELEYQKKAETSKHKLGSAWRAIDRLGVVIGSTLLPATNIAAEGITWAADGLANLAEKGGKATAVITGGAAAFALFKAGQLAKNLVKGKADQLRAGSALEVAKAEAALATNANDATKEIRELNRELSRTDSRGRRRGNGYDSADGDLGSDKKNKKNKKVSTKKRTSKIGGKGLKSTALNLLSFGTAYLPDINLNRLPASQTHLNAASPMSSASKVVSKKAIKPSDIKSSGLGSADGAIETAADATTKLGNTASSTVNTVSDAATKLAHGTVKVIRPLAVVSDVVQLGGAIKSGDNKAIATTSGEIAGGAAGAWGGATAGAAAGTAVFPVVGTAIGAILGGVLGGYFGGEAGEWAVGEAFDGMFGDKETGSAMNKAREKQDKEQQQIKQLTQTNKIDLKSTINIQLTSEENARNIKQVVEQALDEAVNQNLIPAINNTLNHSVEDSTSLAP
jgi:TP901 family phage tail tape measure protein